MNNLGLTFFDLYRLHRPNYSMWGTLKVAWKYRNFVPDHRDSERLRQEIAAIRAESAKHMAARA